MEEEFPVGGVRPEIAEVDDVARSVCVGLRCLCGAGSLCRLPRTSSCSTRPTVVTRCVTKTRTRADVASRTRGRCCSILGLGEVPHEHSDTFHVPAKITHVRIWFVQRSYTIGAVTRTRADVASRTRGRCRSVLGLGHRSATRTLRDLSCAHKDPVRPYMVRPALVYGRCRHSHHPRRRGRLLHTRSVVV